MLKETWEKKLRRQRKPFQHWLGKRRHIYTQHRCCSCAHAVASEKLPELMMDFSVSPLLASLQTKLPAQTNITQAIISSAIPVACCTSGWKRHMNTPTAEIMYCFAAIACGTYNNSVGHATLCTSWKRCYDMVLTFCVAHAQALMKWMQQFSEQWQVCLQASWHLCCATADRFICIKLSFEPHSSSALDSHSHHSA